MLLLACPVLLYVLGSLAEVALAGPAAGGWAPATLFRRLALGLLLAGWLGVTLAELGRFSAPTLALLLLLASALLLLRLLSGRAAGWRDTWRALWRLGAWNRRGELAALGALLALAAVLFGRPGEDVLGARDPGIYFATGVAIAHGGGILQDDPALRALAADLGDVSVNYWLFQSVHGRLLRFPGQVFVRDLAAGQVEPGFLPWYPVWIAYAVDAGGPAAGLWVNPILATLGVVAVYLAGRALVGPLPAALGAALLALNLGQLWFARNTMAEPATQLLVWTGLYALAAARRRPTLALGALAGLAWGGALLTRVDALLLVPLVGLYLGWQARVAARRAWALVALALLAMGAAHFALHSWLLAPGYTTMVFSPATLAVAAGGIALALTVAGASWALLVWRHPAARSGAGPWGNPARRARYATVALPGSRVTGVAPGTARRAGEAGVSLAGQAAGRGASRDSAERTIPEASPPAAATRRFSGLARGDWRLWIVVGLVAVAALFAYAVRPALPAPLPAGEAGELEAAARESLVRLGWYVTPLGLLLALGGAALLLSRGAWRRALPLLGLLALSLAFYLPNPLVSSDHPWAVRRYLPLVLPGLLLLAAYGAVTLGVLVARGRRAGALVGAALGLAVAWGEWQATAPIVAYREHEGALGQVAALAAQLPADAIVLFPRSSAGMRLSLPLHYLGERSAFVLPAEGPEEGVLRVVRRWRADGRPVYWVVPLGTRFPTPPGVRFAPAGQFAFAAPQLERPLDRLPQGAQPLRFELQLYRVELAPMIP